MLWDIPLLFLCVIIKHPSVSVVLRYRFINTTPSTRIMTPISVYTAYCYVKKVHLPDGFRQNVVHDEPAPLRADQFLAASRAAPFVAGHLLPE